MAVSQLVGAKIHRREDPRLITGHGHFIDAFTRQGAAYVAFVRSPHAHAHIKSIDIADASKAPGVAGVYTARDFKGQLAGTHPAAPAFVAEKKYIPERFPIAEKEVCYQGEIVAVVLADTKGQAADAANLIQVDYEELPAVMDTEKAMAKGSPLVHQGAADNISWDLTYTGPEVTEAAFQEADVVVKEHILQNRLAPVPMDPLGMRMTQFLDVGAYCGTFTAFQACTCLMAGGAYKWKGISARTIGILTNRVPTDPYRGAGRPEATHLVERMVDLVALELKMDPVEIRRKNFIQPTEVPFTQNFGLVIDSGDYDKALDRALELVGYKELRKK